MSLSLSPMYINLVTFERLTFLIISAVIRLKMRGLNRSPFVLDVIPHPLGSGHHLPKYSYGP